MEKAEIEKNYIDFKKRLNDLENVLHVEESKKEISQLELKMTADDF